MRSYAIEADVLSVQNGVDFDKASVLVNPESTSRRLVTTGPR